ncbi:MAG: oligosaccharide flippase family protein [Candidatus Bathyarchaeota archaeon]
MARRVMTRAASGASILSMQSFINTLLGALFFMYMVRVLTKEDMGIYGAVTLVISIAAIVGILGLNYAAARYLPHFSGKNEPQNTRLTAKYIVICVSISASSLALIYFILSNDFSKIMLGTGAYTYIFQAAVLLVFIKIYGLVFTGFLQGIQRFRHLAIFNFLAQIVKISSSVGLLILGFGVVAVIWGAAAYYILFAVLTLPLILKLFRTPKTNTNRDKNVNSISIKALFLFSIPMMGYEIVTFLSASLDQFVVLSFVSITTFGAYVVAGTGATILTTIFAMPLLLTLTPSMSEIYSASGKERVAKAMHSASRYIAMVSIPASFGLAALAPLAIWILAGTTYADATIPLAIMGIGTCFYGFSTMITSSLIALGETRKAMIIIALSALILLAASAALTPVLGISGAAIGKVIMYGGMLLLFIRIGSKVIPITFDKRAIVGCSLSATIMAVLIYAFAFLTHFSVILFPAYLIMGVVIYSLTLAMTRTLTVIDIEFLASIIPQGDEVYHKIRTTIKRSPILLRTIDKLLRSKEN